jgi:hypothetical protein
VCLELVERLCLSRLIVVWSLQLAANYPKEPGVLSRLIGFRDALSPMSRCLGLRNLPPKGRRAVTGAPQQPVRGYIHGPQEDTTGVTATEQRLPPSRNGDGKTGLRGMRQRPNLAISKSLNWHSSQIVLSAIAPTEQKWELAQRDQYRR